MEKSGKTLREQYVEKILSYNDELTIKRNRGKLNRPIKGEGCLYTGNYMFFYFKVEENDSQQFLEVTYELIDFFNDLIKKYGVSNIFFKCKKDLDIQDHKYIYNTWSYYNTHSYEKLEGKIKELRKKYNV